MGIYDFEAAKKQHHPIEICHALPSELGRDETKWVAIMNPLKKLAKNMPFISTAHRKLLQHTRSAEKVFTDIYKGNTWGGEASVSGIGSDTHQTEFIAQQLPMLFREYEITTLLDIPCGDFHWMKDVDRSGIDYLGADIVTDLVQKNNQLYASERVRFQRLNLTRDKLPKTDLVFCRDCLVHLPNADVLTALKNICASESSYLLTTTFSRDAKNVDIAAGQWRVLNLELPPFGLPQPLALIVEGCTVDGNAYRDKALGLWTISDIRRALRLAA